MSSFVPIKAFDASKQLKFFDALKKTQFSGQFQLEDPKGHKWYFYLYLGRVLYATGGTHPVRRWLRNFGAFCPNIDATKFREMINLTDEEVQTLDGCWEFQLLRLWVETKAIAREQAARIIASIVSEILFDVTQASEVTFLSYTEISLKQQLVFLDMHKLVEMVEQQWHGWQNAKVADKTPNQAPVIRYSELLRQQTSPASYQVLTKLLNGSYTLRDIALQRKRDITEIITFLLPYIQSGVVELTDIQDAPVPVNNLPEKFLKLPVALEPLENPETMPLIACVDDSPAVCQAMEKILKSANFRFLPIQDPLRAIATLLTRKPDLIFLDLVMPNTNGYEICLQLRKVSSFRNTPIIILTGNDGVIDRVRAKVVGSTDFLAKPVDAETVLTVAYKHLKPIIKWSSLMS